MFRRGADLREFSDRLPCVRHDGDVYDDIAGDGGGVDVDVHDLRVFGELGELARDAVVEAGAYGKEKVAFGNGGVGGDVPVHAHVADVQRVICGERALAHDGGDHGHARKFCEAGHRRLRAGYVHPAARQKERALRVREHFRRLFQLAHVHAGRRLIAADGDLLRVFVGAGLVLDIFGKIDEDGPRLARAGDVKGFLYDPAEVFAAAHRHRILADGAADADDVDLLKGVVADEVGRHLPREADEGHAVVIGGGDARDEVGRTRAAGDETDARFARGARVAVRRVHEPLLVAGKDDAERRFAVQRVEQVDRHAARIGEQRIHALLDEGLDKELRTFDLHRTIPPMFFCRGYEKRPGRRIAVRGGKIRGTTRFRGISPHSARRSPFGPR